MSEQEHIETTEHLKDYKSKNTQKQNYIDNQTVKAQQRYLWQNEVYDMYTQQISTIVWVFDLVFSNYTDWCMKKKKNIIKDKYHLIPINGRHQKKDWSIQLRQ